MYVVCVRVHVREDRIDAFREAVLDNAKNSRGEPGNARFDVLQEESDPSRFLLFEVYRSPEDFAAHQRTAHYLHWKDTVAEWMAEPRSAIRCTSLFPADSDWG